MPNTTVEFNYAAVIGCDWVGGSTEGINAECEFTGRDLYGDLYSHSFAAKYYYGVTNNQPFKYMTCVTINLCANIPLPNSERL